MTGATWLANLKAREPDALKRRRAIVRRIARKARALTSDEARDILVTFGGPLGPGSMPTQRAWYGCWSQSLDAELRHHLGRALRSGRCRRGPSEIGHSVGPESTTDMDYRTVWIAENNDGAGFAAGAGDDINELELGALVRRSEADDQVAVYRDDRDNVIVVGIANSFSWLAPRAGCPWAIPMPNYTVLTTDFGSTGYTDEEAAEACERMAEHLGEHFRVRPPRAGEAEGTYLDRPDQTLQILGYSIPIPAWVGELISEAWEHALASWDEDYDARHTTEETT
jgi:hypothetical protein